MIERPSIEQLLSASAAWRITWLRESPSAMETASALLDEAKSMVFDSAASVDEFSAAMADAARQAGLPGLESHAWSIRAYALAWSNRFPEALVSVQEATRAAEHSGDPAALGTALLAAVQPLTRIGDLPKALDAATRARAIFESIGDERRAARAMVNAGVVHRSLNDPESALAAFDAAVGCFADQPMVRAQIESNRGEALYALSRFTEAERALLEALSLFESVGVGHAQAAAVVRGNLADLLNREGRLDEAARAYELAIRSIDPSRAPGDQARLRAERAEILIDIGLVDEARLELEAVCPVLKEHELRAEWARGMTALGRAHLTMKAFSNAQAVLEAAIAEHRTLQNPANAARATIVLARVLTNEGKSALAEQSLRAAIAELADRPLELAWLKLSLGQLLLDLRRPEHAEPWLSEAVDAARSLGLRPLLLEALHARGRKRFELKRIVEARRDFDEALAIAHGLRGRLPGERFRVAFADRGRELHQDAMACWIDGSTNLERQRVFEIVERSRNRTLADVIAGAQVLSVGSSPHAEAHALLTEAGRLGQELNAIYSRLSEPMRSDVGETFRERYVKAAASAEQRLGLIESRLASTQEFRGILDSLPTPAEVASHLEPSSAFLEFTRVHNRLIAVVITADGEIHIRNLGEVASVVDAASLVNLELGRSLARGVLPPNSPGSHSLLQGVQRSLTRLYDALIRPIESIIEGRSSLVIAPCAEVQHVPFEALFNGSSYLLERFAIAYAPSASVHCGLLARRAMHEHRAPTGRPLVVGAWDDHAPAIEREVQAIAEALPGARLLAGAQATRAALTEHAPGADLLHIACHSIAPDAGAFSGRLRLADGWMDTREVAALRLRASLVVLSSCESGRGTVVGAEEMYGLVRAFLIAGARSVLAVRWRLNDRLAASQIVQIWTHAVGMQDRNGMSAALRAMQLEWIRNGWHPAAWATYFLLGSPSS